jgi:hypothetical protein
MKLEIMYRWHKKKLNNKLAFLNSSLFFFLFFWGNYSYFILDCVHVLFFQILRCLIRYRIEKVNNNVYKHMINGLWLIIRKNFKLIYLSYFSRFFQN